MFKINLLKEEYKNLVGFRPHFNNSIELPEYLTKTDSGEFYSDKSGALRLDYIQSMLPTGQELSTFLSEKVEAGISSIFNDIVQTRLLNSYGKSILEDSQLLNRRSFLNDTIVNRSRFVGLQITVLESIGLNVILKQIGLQLNKKQSLDIYLYHSDKEEPLKVFKIDTNENTWSWVDNDFDLKAFDLANNLGGGTYLLGYYQDDLEGQAINYTNFNWDSGECNTCSSTLVLSQNWKSINNHFHIYPFYVAEGNYVKGFLPIMEKLEYDRYTSYGLNLRLSVRCDLTDFFLTNKYSFKNLLTLKVCNLILESMKYSTEVNNVEEQIKQFVIRDLEGDKETNYINIPTQYNRELKAVLFNMSGVNNRCLNSDYGVNMNPEYGVL